MEAHHTLAIKTQSPVGASPRPQSPLPEGSPIDPRHARFPYCLVWTPLPIVAWLVPFIGHLGICQTDGVILDFAGPFFVNVDNFAFGATARYHRLDPKKLSHGPQPSMLPVHQPALDLPLGQNPWDDALRATMRRYQHKQYNIFTCNCHSFAAACLNTMAYGGKENWNVVDVVFLILCRGQWVNGWAIVKSLGPLVVMMGVGVWFARWYFLVGWAIFAALINGWFLLGTYGVKGLVEV